MTSHLQKILLLAAAQFAYYAIITLNYRAIATVQYAATFGTDVITGALAFYSIRRVASADTFSERVAYVLGGATGALVALWTSTFLFPTP